LFRRLRSLAIPDCPFINLPEEEGRRGGQGFTAEKMKECRWMKPVLVGQFEFVEWTPDTSAARTDKEPKLVGRE
jgi:bifunctional non-homologous end joining protein LigD